MKIEINLPSETIEKFELKARMENKSLNEEIEKFIVSNANSLSFEDFVLYKQVGIKVF